MSAAPPFVVVSGLAASGKTTVAEPLARALGVRYIAKDAIKEALFDAVGVGDRAWSRTLSRAADVTMVRVAEDCDAAVLDNFWYAETVEELLAPLPRPMVEVFCRCDPGAAVARFRARTRHPGFSDPEPSEELLPVFVNRSRKLPLGTLGPVIEVNSEEPVDIDSLAAQVLAAVPRP